MSSLLWQRKRQWWVRINVPRPLRHLFPGESGKPRDKIAASLGTDYQRAKSEAHRWASAYQELFARAAVMTPTAVRDAEEAIRDAAATREANRQIQEVQLRQWREGVASGAVDLDQETSSRREIVETFRAAGIPEDSLRAMLAAFDATMPSEFRERVAGAAPNPAHVQDLPPASGETISRAAEAWIRAMEADKSAAPRKQTIDGHRIRVRAFVEHCRDLPLSAITRAQASDFLASLQAERSNRTTKNYATTLAMIIEHAKGRGRFTGENPFRGHKFKLGKTSYDKFTEAELQTIFDALPREIAPKKHTPETALPWAALISLYSGLRLEEVCQLNVADIREVNTNGARVLCFDVHNGGKNNVKPSSSVRLVPVHDKLIEAGLLDYAKALPKAGLFPGLVRRKSRHGKISARISELFRERLIALGIKRQGIVFHSFRHCVGRCLDAAGTRQADAARVLGHSVQGMTFGVYGEGELLRLASIVQSAIRYDLRIARAA
jgi:integrase